MRTWNGISEDILVDQSCGQSVALEHDLRIASIEYRFSVCYSRTSASCTLMLEKPLIRQKFGFVFLFGDSNGDPHPITSCDVRKVFREKPSKR